MRHEKEAEAYSMLGYADKALRQASSAEGLAKASLAETEDAEAEAVRWSTKVQELEDRLRSAQQDVAKSAAAAQDAKTAEKRAEAAQAEAIREKKHQSALSSEPAKELARTRRSTLDAFKRGTGPFKRAGAAGLAVLQLEQWMAMLHINRFFVSLAVMAVGTGLLLLPARAQAASFAVCALVVLPVLLAGAFREFLRFVASSPPSELLGSVAGAECATCVPYHLEGQTAFGCSSVPRMAGELVASWLPLPEALAALSAMALGYAGAAAGLYRRRATQAFAVGSSEIQGPLRAAGWVPPAFLSQHQPALAPAEAYLEDIVPWADKQSEKASGWDLRAYVVRSDIRFVQPDYIIRLHQEGRVFPRRQEAEGEEGALFQLHPTAQAGDFKYVAVSHCWESREHPDPHGFQLAQLASWIDGFWGEQTRDAVLFIDYVSLYQFGNRTETQDASFRRSMENMSLLYANSGADFCQGVLSISRLTPWWWKTDRSKAIPEFQEQVRTKGVAFTHRSDISHVIALQGMVYKQKLVSTKGLSLKRLARRDRHKLPGILLKSNVLTELVLRATLFNEADIEALAGVLCSKELETLQLMSVPLCSRSLRHLCSAFRPQLRFLTLSWCSLRDHQMPLLAESLSTLPLEQLDLSYNRIGSNGAMNLANALCSHPVLKCLDLSGNRLGDEGARALAEALIPSHAMEKLILKGTWVRSSELHHGQHQEIQLHYHFYDNKVLVTVFLRTLAILDGCILPSFTVQTEVGGTQFKAQDSKVVGSTFCEYGRLAWLLLQLPALVHLLTAPGMDVAPFPWESEEPAKSSVAARLFKGSTRVYTAGRASEVPEASPPEEPEETETNAVQVQVKGKARKALVEHTLEAEAETQPEVAEAASDPVIL
ncbi:Nlrp4b [Symbiodinium sp. CCMP2456]|nr:Nlrp4b [Symbiodinium sp. CCMP2456]